MKNINISLREETKIVGSEIIKAEAGRPSWKNRKKVIFSTLIFCAFCILYIMFQGNDTRVNETIILGCFGMATSIIGFYVAGAAWTDISIEKIKSDGGSSTGASNARPVLEPKIITPLADGRGSEDK